MRRRVRSDPLSHVLGWPSVAAARDGASPPPSALFVDNREWVELTPALRDAPALYFPMWYPNYRCLGQVAAMVAFGDGSTGLPAGVQGGMAAAAHGVLKRGVRYGDLVWRVAAAVIAQLGGLFAYSSMHVRRNDLQYKEVFISANVMMRNVGALFRPNEPLYVATDEGDAAFFDAVRKGHTVYRWHDFLSDRGGRAVQRAAAALGLAGGAVPDKVVGLVEQVICAGGRAFVGTEHSTYSAYIARLRGYIGAPDQGFYKATARYGKSCDPAGGQPSCGRPVQGQEYKYEFDVMWRDAL